MKFQLRDEELGIIYVQRRHNARRFNFRCAADGIYVSMPPMASSKELEEALESVRPKLLESRSMVGPRLIDFDYRIDAPYFQFQIHPCSGQRITARTAPGKMDVYCPETTDFSEDRVQQWLRKVIVEALKRNAEVVLPPRLEALAQKHGFSYRSVRVNSSLSSWGCCTGDNHIRLSWRLLMLPQELMDYVLLHELCHIPHKDHSPNFWRTLSGLVGTDAKALQRQLVRSQIVI